jgi:hypothetical protein
MRHRTSIQTILARTFPLTGGDGLLLVPDLMMRRLVVSPPRRLPSLRPSACQQTDDACSLAGRSTHSWLLQSDSVATNHGVCVSVVASASLYGRLQVDVSIERQFSRIFPAHPRSLASVLIPRPAARRGSASAAPPCGFRLSENLYATNAKRFSEPSEKAPLGLGSGAHSRRFAQECPEGNPGKYTKEK